MYQCLEHWVQVTNSLPEEGGMVAKLMQHVLDDIKPLISQTKVMLQDYCVLNLVCYLERNEPYSSDSFFFLIFFCL